jgi:hypothetical protein
MTRDEQIRLIESYGDGPVTRAQLAVLRCPHRGDVLPVSRQPEGCGGCGERSECSDGRGPIGRPGEVSISECLSCVLRGDRVT